MTVKEQLDQRIPESAVEQRDGGGGKKLSYLSGAYVINRLNEVLGQGGWYYGIQKLTKVFEGEVEQYSGKVFGTSYICELNFVAIVDGKQAGFTEVGYGDGTDKKSPGKAHELATKEAVTDALKRAAKNLGISMGLGLYFKSGEYVDETIVQTTIKPSPGVTKPTTVAVPKAAAAALASNPVPSGKAPTEQLPSESKQPFTDTKILRQKIKSAYAVLEAQKKISKTEFVTNFLEGGRVDTISNDQVTKTLGLLKTKFPELGIA